jgi:hypothetical protein
MVNIYLYAPWEANDLNVQFREKIQIESHGSTHIVQVYLYVEYGDGLRGRC